MIVATDILIGEDGDLLIRGGDFVVGSSDSQHIQHILLATTGDWTQSPQIGVGIREYANANNDATTINELRRVIQINAKMDGMKVDSMQLDDLSKFKIEVTR